MRCWKTSDLLLQPTIKLVVLKNPFPLRTLTSKQPLYGVRLLVSKFVFPHKCNLLLVYSPHFFFIHNLRGTTIETISEVKPEIVLDERSSFTPPNLTSKKLHEMVATFYGFDLNFTSFKGSKVVPHSPSPILSNLSFAFF